MITTQVIYGPRGKAAEYFKLAINLYSGCDHRCIYCYAPAATRRDIAQFQRPVPRVGILEKLQADVNKLALPCTRPTEHILLCFTCDPYQHLDVELGLTRQAIEIMKLRGLKVAILSKGGQRAERDLDLLTPDDKFGATLTLLDDKQSREWEPRAALPWERMAALSTAHERGIPTFASLEPVIDPTQTLEIISQTHKFVDQFKVGVMNYHPIAKTIDWPKFARDVVSKLESVGAAYYLKDDLKKHLRP